MRNMVPGTFFRLPLPHALLLPAMARAFSPYSDSLGTLYPRNGHPTSPYTIQGLKAGPVTAILSRVSCRGVTEFDHLLQTQ